MTDNVSNCNACDSSSDQYGFSVFHVTMIYPQINSHPITMRGWHIPFRIIGSTVWEVVVSGFAAQWTNNKTLNFASFVLFYCKTISWSNSGMIDEIRCIATLTHCPLHKVADILQTTFSKVFFANQRYRILVKISPRLALTGPIDKKSALVQVMVWCRAGTNPLPGPMLTQFTDAYMRH